MQSMKDLVKLMSGKKMIYRVSAMASYPHPHRPAGNLFSPTVNTIMDVYYSYCTMLSVGQYHYH